MALEDTAERLIAKFGRTASLLRKSLTPADSAAPWDGAASEGTSESVTAVFVNFNKDQINGTTIQAGDMQALIAAKATSDIGAEDTIVDGTTRWRIIAVNLVKPGNTAYLWKAQVRS